MHIIEVNEAGDVLDFWGLNQILDPYRGDLPLGDTAGVGAGRNWAHVNAIDYDADDHSIIVSARHQGVVKIGRDKAVKWILASPQGWPQRLRDKVLTPVESEGFDWSWTQHTAWLAGKGTLTVFDNGWGRDFAPTKLTGSYSRAVEYKVDEAKVGYRALVIDLATAF